MPATLKLTHKAIGAEVRRGPYDVVVDGERVGSVEMNQTIEIPVEPGRHTLQVRGAHSTRLSPPGVALGPGQNASRKRAGRAWSSRRVRHALVRPSGMLSRKMGEEQA